MKVLCVPCDEAMVSESSEGPEEDTLLAITFGCPSCGKRVGLLTNPAETQMATSMGYKVSGRKASVEPMEGVRGALAQGRVMGTVEGDPIIWTEAAERRLTVAPRFAQGMIRVLYNDYAMQQGYTEITPAVMNEARDTLGMEGM